MPEIEKQTKTETNKKIQQKKRGRPKKTNVPEGLEPANVESANMEIDLNSFDWGEDCKLNEKQKFFVVWFTYPGRTYHNAKQSAIKAGYTEKTAHVWSTSLRRNPEISSYIKKFDDMYVRESLDDFYHKAIEDKIVRATFDVKDFHEVKTYTDKDGNAREYLSIKDPSELTSEQRKCIDGIKINNNGTPSYEFANRTHEVEVLMKLKERLDGDGKEEDSFQVETTAEIIKGNLQVKTKVIKNNRETAELSELTTDSAKEREEED